MDPRQNRNNQISVHNIDDQGNITGQTGLSRVVANYGNISDLNSFSPELQAAIQGYQNPKPQNYMSDLLQQQLNPKPIRPGEPGSPGYPGTQGGSSINQGPGGLLPSMNPFDDPNYRPTYSGSMMGGADNPYSSLINDYIQSDYFDSSSFDQGFAVARPAVTINDPLFGQLHGGYNPYNTQGFSDFLENSYGGMQGQMNNDMVKSQEFMDKFNMYGDAYNIRFPGENPGMPGTMKLLGPDGNPMQPIAGDSAEVGGPKILGPFDPNFVPSSPFDPVTSTGGQETYTGNPMPGFNFEGGEYYGGPAPLEPGVSLPNTTDIFGAGNNPINNNPIAPMPSPITPPPGMSSGHSHDDLLSGIGKLFEQYFPQRGGTSTPSATQPVFDAVGNSAPAQQTSPQVFGNMITPFGRQG